MSWVIYLFGSGMVFFLGAGFILAALATFSCCRRPHWRALASLCVVIGLLLIALSATPLPYWLYAIAGTATVLWLVTERHAKGWLIARRKVLRALLVVVWTITIALELPYQLTTTVATNGSPTLYIIGDSVTAGMGGERETWPRLLADTHSVEAVDLAKVGATAASPTEKQSREISRMA